MPRPAGTEQTFAARIAYRETSAGAFWIWSDAMRRLTELISEGFIWGVGITPPKEGEQRVAALYITATLIGSILAAIAMFVFLLHRLSLV